MNEDQLRAKSLALFHGLLSGWAEGLTDEVSTLQGDLLEKLDQLKERLSKYEENIDEDRILAFANEALSAGGGSGGGGGAESLGKLRASITKLDEGTSLTEVLTLLLAELSQFAPRVALFILKGGSCIGWNGQGFDQSPGFSNEGVKRISVPTSASTVFSDVISRRASFVGDSNKHQDNIQLLSRIGNVLPTSIFATPLILRDRIAAVVYADSGDGPAQLQESEALEILTAYASKLLDALSAQKSPVQTGEHLAPPAQPTPTPAPVTPPPAPPQAPPPQARQAPQAPPAPAPGPTPVPSPMLDEQESGTVMFNSADMNLPNFSDSGQVTPPPSPVAPPAAPAPAPAPPPPATGGGADLDSMDPTTRKKHEEAMRFARLLVSEIKLYNEAKVQAGRGSRDIYDKLRDDIERSRQLYKERVAEPVRASTSYFGDELVRILADGDASAMGASFQR